MEIIFFPDARDDYLSYSRKVQNRINRFIQEIIDLGPLQGTGKPELLHGDLSGIYSRRINKKDRLLYRITENRLEVIACRFHYLDV